VIALDTNLLIYAHRAGATQHEAAKDAIQRAADTGGWGFASPVVSEFWSQVTHPRFPGGASSAEQAAGFLAAMETAGAKIYLPRPSYVGQLIGMAGELKVYGVRVFDVQIAIIALGGGATELWTYDARFTAVPGLDIVHLS